MIAGLPMYDRPETRAANDRLWAAIRDRLRAAGIDAPDGLDRDTAPFDLWTDPELLLAQTCGFPYRAALQDRVALVATPDHGLPGCPPGFYNSVLVARADDRRGFRAFRGARLAYNEPMSQSGYAAPQFHAALHGFRFARMLRSGSHRDSARAVAGGAADIAALDAVSWALIRRFDGFAADLREVERTLPTLALPYITRPDGPVAVLQAALAEGIASLDPGSRALLQLRGTVDIPAESYLRVPNPPPPGDGRG